MYSTCLKDLQTNVLLMHKTVSSSLWWWYICWSHDAGTKYVSVILFRTTVLFRTPSEPVWGRRAICAYLVVFWFENLNVSSNWHWVPPLLVVKIKTTNSSNGLIIARTWDDQHWSLIIPYEFLPLRIQYIGWGNLNKHQREIWGW